MRQVKIMIILDWKWLKWLSIKMESKFTWCSKRVGCRIRFYMEQIREIPDW